MAITAQAPVTHQSRPEGRQHHRLKRFIAQSLRHGYWISIWSIVGWVGTAASPALLDKPFLLMLMAPRTLFVAMASDSASFVPFVLLGTLRLSVADASYFIVGAKLPNEFEPKPLAPRNRLTRAVNMVVSNINAAGHWFCSRPKFAGLFLFMRPNAKYLAVAGAYGVNPVVAGVSATAGTIAFLSAVHIGVSALL